MRIREWFKLQCELGKCPDWKNIYAKFIVDYSNGHSWIIYDPTIEKYAPNEYGFFTPKYQMTIADGGDIEPPEGYRDLCGDDRTYELRADGVNFFTNVDIYRKHGLL
jgi:hypothetical protein